MFATEDACEALVTDDGVPLIRCDGCRDFTREDVLEDVSGFDVWPVSQACPACAAIIRADDDDPTAGDRWPEDNEVA